MTPAVKPLTVTDCIILAALRVARCEPRLTIEALTMECWRLWPARFGIRGFETKSAETHRVRCALFETKPTSLIRRGLLRKGERCWLLTEAGAERAAALEAACGR